MSDRHLLLLGLLKFQSQHGYQINEFIENNMRCILPLKKPTAYAILNKLQEEGYIQMKEEQTENRPTKKVFSITEKGENLFLELMESSLKNVDEINFSGDVAFLFLDKLPKEKVIYCLDKRIEKLEEIIEEYKAIIQTPPKGHKSHDGIAFAIKRRSALLKEDLSCVKNLRESFLLNTQEV